MLHPVLAATLRPSQFFGWVVVVHVVLADFVTVLNRREFTTVYDRERLRALHYSTRKRVCADRIGEIALPFFAQQSTSDQWNA
jgi:hypothetical protein